MLGCATFDGDISYKEAVAVLKFKAREGLKGHIRNDWVCGKHTGQPRSAKAMLKAGALKACETLLLHAHARKKRRSTIGAITDSRSNAVGWQCLVTKA